MAKKSDFTPEQWRRIIRAPLLAGVAIGASDPSGPLGVLQESFASAKALADAKADAACPLVAAVIEDLFTAEGRVAARDGVQRLIEGTEIAEIKVRALAELRSVAEILRAAAPRDAASFANWLGELSRRVAQAASEGGYLGIGGEKVSAAEEATLAEIFAALRE